ncbi:hypothetical protein WCLP8_520005 [uncultured Gammaproteobacteria bacterium]
MRYSIERTGFGWCVTRGDGTKVSEPISRQAAMRIASQLQTDNLKTDPH